MFHIIFERLLHFQCFSLFFVAVASYRLLGSEIALVLCIANWGWHHVSHHTSQVSSWLLLALHSQASPLLFEFMQIHFEAEEKSLKGLCLQWFISKCPCEDVSKLCKALLKVQQTIFYDWCDAMRNGGLTADQVRPVLPAALQVTEFTDSKRWFLGNRHAMFLSMQVFPMWLLKEFGSEFAVFHMPSPMF